MKRTLTDEDIKAIADAVQINHDCTFTEDDSHDIRTLLKIYRESTSAIRRGFIALVLLGTLALFILGASFKFKVGG
jgi:hypothetical protein